MQAYEYKIVEAKVLHLYSGQIDPSNFNELGDKGWYLSQTLNDGAKTYLVFIRPKD